MNTQDIVQRLWNLCNILRDDGITYHQYVTELTHLLFLKMAKETEVEDQLPKGYRWADLEKKEGITQLEFYRGMLLHLGTHGSRRVQEIYANASTTLKQPRNLKKLVDAIDELDWYSARHEGLGDLYEGQRRRKGVVAAAVEGAVVAEFRAVVWSISAMPKDARRVTPGVAPFLSGPRAAA